MDLEILNTIEEDQNCTDCRIQKFELKEVLIIMDNGKAVGPDNISIEIQKCLEEKGWLTVI